MSNYQDIINKYDYQLNIFEFAKEIDHDVNELNGDEFWNSIESYKWIYIDNDVLIWIGYPKFEIKKNKQNYIKLLNKQFDEGIEYKYINNKEFKEIYLGTIVSPRTIDINTHNKTKHLIVSPDCFKESLMMLKTDIAKNIRKLYISNGKLFKSYYKYIIELQQSN